MASSPLEISDIICEIKDGEYIFTVKPLTSAKVIISTDNKHTNIIQSSYVGGALKVAETDLKDLPYAFIFKESGGSYSSPAQIFTQKPEVIAVEISSDYSIRIFFKKTTSLAVKNKVDIRAAVNGAQIGRTVVDKKDCAFSLYEIGIDSSINNVNLTVTFYYTDSYGVNIASSPTVIDLPIKSPEPLSVSFDGEYLTAEFNRKCDITAEILQYNTCIGNINKKSGKFDLRGLVNGGGYTVRFAVKYDYGVSLYGTAISVITDMPTVISREYYDGKITIKFAKTAYYKINENIVYGDSYEAQTSASEITVSFANTNNYGPCITVNLANPAVYTYSGYYCQANNPYEIPFYSSAVTLKYGYSEFENSSFIVKNQTLKIKNDSHLSENIRDDFIELLKSADSYEKVKELRDIILNYLPLKAEDMLFFKYGFNAEDGYCDIQEGINLSVEYQHYMNIPEVPFNGESQDPGNNELSGFTGGQCVNYRAVLRNGNIIFEPFIGAMTCSGALSVPAPEQITESGKQVGGAGIADLMFKGLAAPFVKLVYPQEFSCREQSNHGSVYCGDNVCLIASSSLTETEEAAVKLREYGDLSKSENIAVTYFRGRTAVIPQVIFFVNDNILQRPLGYTIGDLAAEFNCLAENIKFIRSGFVFYRTASDIPVFSGDKVKI